MKPLIYALFFVGSFLLSSLHGQRATEQFFEPNNVSLVEIWVGDKLQLLPLDERPIHNFFLEFCPSLQQVAQIFHSVAPGYLDESYYHLSPEEIRTRNISQINIFPYICEKSPQKDSFHTYELYDTGQLSKLRRADSSLYMSCRYDSLGRLVSIRYNFFRSIYDRFFKNRFFKTGLFEIAEREIVLSYKDDEKQSVQIRYSYPRYEEQTDSLLNIYREQGKNYTLLKEDFPNMSAEQNYEKSGNRYSYSLSSHAHNKEEKYLKKFQEQIFQSANYTGFLFTEQEPGSLSHFFLRSEEKAVYAGKNGDAIFLKYVKSKSQTGKRRGNFRLRDSLKADYNSFYTFLTFLKQDAIRKLYRICTVFRKSNLMEYSYEEILEVEDCGDGVFEIAKTIRNKGTVFLDYLDCVPERPKNTWLDLRAVAELLGLKQLCIYYNNEELPEYIGPFRANKTYRLYYKVEYSYKK